jgi:hypothetical protein
MENTGSTSGRITHLSHSYQHAPKPNRAARCRCAICPQCRVIHATAAASHVPTRGGTHPSQEEQSTSSACPEAWLFACLQSSSSRPSASVIAHKKAGKSAKRLLSCRSAQPAKPRQAVHQAATHQKHPHHCCSSQGPACTPCTQTAATTGNSACVFALSWIRQDAGAKNAGNMTATGLIQLAGGPGLGRAGKHGSRIAECYSELDQHAIAEVEPWCTC